MQLQRSAWVGMSPESVTQPSYAEHCDMPVLH
jgi:hypothetical protein